MTHWTWTGAKDLVMANDAPHQCGASSLTPGYTDRGVLQGDGWEWRQWEGPDSKVVMWPWAYASVLILNTARNELLGMANTEDYGQIRKGKPVSPSRGKNQWEMEEQVYAGQPLPDCGSPCKMGLHATGLTPGATCMWLGHHLWPHTHSAVPLGFT